MRMALHTATNGRYFIVLTSSTYNGNLGGLSGANSNCLSDLNANNWQGKSDVTLNSTTVKAWLCDGSSCQNPQASTGYVFARSGSTTSGGASLFTDASGLGPYVDWTAQSNVSPWSASIYFNSTNPYWTARATGTNTAWGSAGSTDTCTNWTSSNSGKKANRGDETSTTPTDWWAAGTTACNSTRRLICLVTQPGSDDQPDAFDFTDVTLATTSTVYSASATVSCFTGTLMGSVVSDV
jgi:hypothetical protein